VGAGDEQGASISADLRQHCGESTYPVDLSLQTGVVGFFDSSSTLLFELTL
jgi:hypothetical protein